MAAHGSPSRKAGIGPLQFAILRAISYGWHDVASIRKHLAAKTAGENFNDIILGMTQRGLIQQARGRRLYLTKDAYSHLPRPDALVIATGHYKPPEAPPRRPNPDWRCLPSLMGGTPVPYRPHV